MNEIKGRSDGLKLFPISRDPPEGGTISPHTSRARPRCGRFQFLGIPPKGERHLNIWFARRYLCFQFLGIPPKGERQGSILLINGDP